MLYCIVNPFLQYFSVCFFTMTHGKLITVGQGK